ncbi:MAG: hypothetical protein FJ271_12200 [Planctomycetes bacterium]|nr:hypothetical protein [Planctomycetota bacterium]
MNLSTLLARMFQSSPRPAVAQRRRVRLEMEGLEERRVLSNTQMAPAMPQLAQAQQPQQPQQVQQYKPGHYLYYVTHYKTWAGQQFCKQTEIYTNKQQANKRAQYWQNRGYCTRTSQIWVKPSSTPVLGPTIKV